MKKVVLSCLTIIPYVHPPLVRIRKRKRGEQHPKYLTTLGNQVLKILSINIRTSPSQGHMRKPILTVR